MRYYYLRLDGYNITATIDTFEEQEGLVGVTREEYRQAQLHNKFNPDTREFSEPKTIPVPDLTLEERLQQMQAGMAQIAMQTAKNTLLQGGSL